MKKIAILALVIGGVALFETFNAPKSLAYGEHHGHRYKGGEGKFRGYYRGGGFGESRRSGYGYYGGGYYPGGYPTYGAYPPYQGGYYGNPGYGYGAYPSYGNGFNRGYGYGSYPGYGWGNYCE
jgi:hypothetical protein